MTQDEIIEMARQAGYLDLSLTDRGMELKELEAFAKLVAQHEREICEGICNRLSANGPQETKSFEFRYGASCCASTIRARGKA